MFMNALTMKAGRWYAWMRSLISCLAKQGNHSPCGREMTRSLILNMSGMVHAAFLCSQNHLRGDAM